MPDQHPGPGLPATGRPEPGRPEPGRPEPGRSEQHHAEPAHQEQHHPELWLIRHGQTEWSTTRRHTGRTDVPLDAAGQDAARALAPRLAGVAFDLVLSSPLRRARRTAELAGLHPEIEPDAVEWDYGVYEGRTSAEIRDSEPGWSVWESEVRGGESLKEVSARADAVLTRVRARATERAVLVAHAHFLRVLAARWIDVPPATARRFMLGTATVSVLGWDRGLAVIDRWNT
jgi:probable phosphoglycerate mutase